MGDLMMISVLGDLRGTGVLTAFQRLAAYVARGEARPQTLRRGGNMTRSKIATCLLFDHGQAREAAEFFASIFRDSRLVARLAAPSDYPGGKQGHELTVEFTVLGMPFVGLDGGPRIDFNEIISFQVYTDSQEETDRYWTAIIGDGGTESRCGWCKDKFGLSWQIVPRALLGAIAGPDKAAGVEVTNTPAKPAA